MSQEVVNLATPTGLNWNEHSLGSAITVTGADASAASSLGLVKCVRPWKIGKYVTTANAKPARMIGLRPILSDSQPKMMKNGVPSSSAVAIRICAVTGGTFTVSDRMAILRFAHSPNASDNGRLEPLPRSFMRWNTGDSLSLSRIQIETASRIAESRNGIRQPQAAKVGS